VTRGGRRPYQEGKESSETVRFGGGLSTQLRQKNVQNPSSRVRGFRGGKKAAVHRNNWETKSEDKGDQQQEVPGSTLGSTGTGVHNSQREQSAVPGSEALSPHFPKKGARGNGGGKDYRLWPAIKDEDSRKEKPVRSDKPSRIIRGDGRERKYGSHQGMGEIRVSVTGTTKKAVSV